MWGDNRGRTGWSSIRGKRRGRLGGRDTKQNSNGNKPGGGEGGDQDAISGGDNTGRGWLSPYQSGKKGGLGYKGKGRLSYLGA